MNQLVDERINQPFREDNKVYPFTNMSQCWRTLSLGSGNGNQILNHFNIRKSRKEQIIRQQIPKILSRKMSQFFFRFLIDFVQNDRPNCFWWACYQVLRGICACQFWGILCRLCFDNFGFSLILKGVPYRTWNPGIGKKFSQVNVE